MPAPKANETPLLEQIIQTQLEEIKIEWHVLTSLGRSMLMQTKEHTMTRDKGKLRAEPVGSITTFQKATSEKIPKKMQEWATSPQCYGQERIQKNN